MQIRAEWIVHEYQSRERLHTCVLCQRRLDFGERFILGGPKNANVVHVACFERMPDSSAFTNSRLDRIGRVLRINRLVNWYVHQFGLPRWMARALNLDEIR